VATLLALLLAGCDPAGHPFAEDRLPSDAPILQVKDAAGVVVAPVEGVPPEAGSALAEALAAALRGLEIPASTGPGNRHSFRIAGTATAVPGAGGGGLTIRWTVRDGDGGEAGADDQHASVTAAAWSAPTAEGFHDLAATEAKTLSGLVVEAPPVERKSATALFVREVKGAPGDGSHALASALTYLLKHRGLPVGSEAKDAVVVAGEVAVSAGGGGKDHVKIVWHVLKPDGSDIGQIGQENDVPHGSLDGRWGQTAMAVAMAGIDDIVRIANLAAGP
jgi:hypothetical protein